jgi:hypothetical protein
MKSLLFKILVGKNAPSLGRALAALVVGAILASVLFASGSSPELPPIPGDDPALVEAYQQHVPSAAEVRDGLTVDELVRVAIAFLIFWVARLNSWLRARNLDWLAKAIGFLIGRSIPSLIRSLMDVAAGGLLYLGIARPEAAHMPLAGVGEALILFVASRVFSAIEDGKRNPVLAKISDIYDADPFAR